MRLPHYLELQTKSTAYTGATWTKLRDQWGKVTALGAKDEAQLSAMGADITHKILFRQRPAVRIGVRAVRTVKAYEITAVDQLNKQFTVANDQTTEFFADQKVLVRLSTGNDLEYKVTAISLVSGSTVLTVNEAIADATADGDIRIIKYYEVRGIRELARMHEARATEVQ